MKKKLVLALLCLTLSATTVACGSSNTANVDTSNLSAEEMQELIADLQEKNEKLEKEFAKLKGDDKQSKQETWADDYVIAFCDNKFTENMKKLTGKSSDITYGDVKDIRQIGNGFNIFYFDYLDSFKYFTSLECLYIGVNKEDMRGIEKLTNLTELNIMYDSEITDISAVADIPNLTILKINEAPDLTDISALSNSTSLEEIHIFRCNSLEEISKDLLKIPTLKLIDVYGCELINNHDTLRYTKIGDGIWEDQDGNKINIE